MAASVTPIVPGDPSQIITPLACMPERHSLKLKQTQSESEPILLEFEARV
jgi:hypothetical protein